MEKLQNKNTTMTEERNEPKHYVLVHGLSHGAWCWYKLKPLLESAGHRVTTLDLAASGINTKKIEDTKTFSQYSEPLLELMASLPPNEKVVLVGHSFGGMSIALAMDTFPHKVAVGVFLSAFLPDTDHAPSHVLQEHLRRKELNAAEWFDTEFSRCGDMAVMLFGPKYITNALYQLCSIEDVELAKALLRPGSSYIEDLSKARKFSKEGFGSVPRAYIVCDKDLAIPLEDQLWMIQNAGVNHVEEIKGSDHMAMLCMPQEVCLSLLGMASRY